VGEDSEVGLALAAEDHVADIGFTGAVSHASSDGTSGYKRVCRYGKMQAFGECLWYGSEKADARCMVLDLIVDDGVASRGHRHCVLSPKYDTVGCAYGPHATFGKVSAMEFAGSWEPFEKGIEARQQSGPLKPSGQEESRKNVQTQWKVLGTCPVCKEAIRGGAVVEIEKIGKLHKACFSCKECSKALSGVPFNVHQGLPYCKECYHSRHGEKCTACSQPICGGMVKCSLGIFHVDCVTCSNCEKSIGKNSFSTASGAITCQACAGSCPLGAASKLSTGLATATRRAASSGASSGASTAPRRGAGAARAPAASPTLAAPERNGPGCGRDANVRRAASVSGRRNGMCAAEGSSVAAAPSRAARAAAPRTANSGVAVGSPARAAAALRGQNPAAVVSSPATTGAAGRRGASPAGVAFGAAPTKTTRGGKAVATAAPATISFAQAGATVMGMGMDYGNL